MAVPKGKVSKARRDKRRSSHWKLETPGIVTCPKCGAYRLPHRMCKNCLTYNGRSFGQVEAQQQTEYPSKGRGNVRKLPLPCGIAPASGMEDIPKGRRSPQDYRRNLDC